jgi:hypothetical protein
MTVLSGTQCAFFLRTNSTQVFILTPTQKESYVSSLRLEAVKMLENTSSRVSINHRNSGSSMKVEELLALISALHLNKTLKTLVFQPPALRIFFTVDEVNQLVSIQ